MIGLFGVYRKDREAPADLEALARTVSPRYALDAPAGTGAALGRVAHKPDLSGGRAAAASGNIVAVACGEIFNLQEFSDLGESLSHAADVIVRLAERDALDRLAEANGQFCAAVYDRDAHRLTLITDRLATFPVHLWRRDGEVVFATQIYTLIGDPRVPRRADPAALAQLFTMQRTIGRITPVAGIAALPAACILEIEGDGERERRYWELSWRGNDFSLAEGAELLAQALTRAVARQSDDGRIGLLLSGGVDSRLILAAVGDRRPSCWTTASYEGNPELVKARRVAETFDAEHHALIVPPPETLRVLDQTVVESSGLYPASTPMSAFLPALGEACDAALTGYGIDFTLRGYYLPAKFAEIAGSRTRLPALRAIPRRPTGRDVLGNLRQGLPRATVDRIVRRERRDEWWRGQAEAMQDVLAPWLASDEPYNAWDAFILHAVSKHYAFTSMMAVRAVCNLRMPSFDNEVFELYLRMPPAWRCSGRMVQLALRRLSPEAARLPNANTGFRAHLHPWLEVLGLLGRATLRRLGLVRRPWVPSPVHSLGSWQNLAALYREDPDHRVHFQAVRARLDGLSFGILDSDNLALCIDEHLDGRASHAKLLRQLLTHDAWVRTFGIEGFA